MFEYYFPWVTLLQGVILVCCHHFCFKVKTIMSLRQEANHQDVQFNNFLLMSMITALKVNFCLHFMQQQTCGWPITCRVVARQILVLGSRQGNQPLLVRSSSLHVVGYRVTPQGGGTRSSSLQHSVSHINQCNGKAFFD